MINTFNLQLDDLIYENISNKSDGLKIHRLGNQKCY